MRALLTGLAIGLIAAIPPTHAAEVVMPSGVAMTQTVVTLAAGTDMILGASPSRRYLCLMNIGSGLVNLGFDQSAVAGSGWALEAASAAGHQGGSMCWENTTVTASVVHAISAAGSTVVVLEGR